MRNEAAPRPQSMWRGRWRHEAQGSVGVWEGRAINGVAFYDGNAIRRAELEKQD
jgi:hypothetical protein